MQGIKGHVLVVGETMCGKTRMVKQIVNQQSREGIPLLVLTPLWQDSEWEADLITDDKEKFYAYVFSHTGCNLVIDEAGSKKMVGSHGDQMNDIATRGRHHGHRVWIITQRATMVDISTRTQCNNVFAFRTGKYDAGNLSENFADDLFLQCPGLEDGEAIIKLKGYPAFREKVFKDL